MSATAILLKQAGYQISGTDAGCHEPVTSGLAKADISPLLGYAPENIPRDVDFFIVGRNAKLAPSENEEVRCAYESGKPVYSFPEMLGTLTKNRKNVVVAGSYGKSTTASLIAHILQAGGVDAGYFIGAEPVSLPSPAYLGTHETFVLEGDEYPSAHDDSRAKFMHLHPSDVVLTSVVHDHINVYPTFEEYQRPFQELLTLLPNDGLVIVSHKEPGALKLATHSGREIVTYGVDSGMYHAKDIAYDRTTTFSLVCPDGNTIPLATTQLGTHNVEDIIGASAYVLSRKLISPEQLPLAILSFGGVRRRLDNIAPQSRVPVYEGFGTSYEKAVSAIAAIRLHFPEKRLVTIFEPHTFGWRNRGNLLWYDDVFQGSELVFVATPETQGAKTHDQISYSEIVDRIHSSGIETHTYTPTNIASVVNSLHENDVVLILTSGSLENSIIPLAEEITTRFHLEII